jgi:hypothetical protein
MNENNKLTDKELMLKCVELILNKNKVHHLTDILIESEKLYEFIVAKRK